MESRSIPAAIGQMLLLMCICGLAACGSDRRAFLNGQILTMNADNHIAEALLIEDGKILAVGTMAEIEPLVDAGTQVSDLQGKTLMPGIIDAHGHFPGSGQAVFSEDLNSPPIGKVTTIAQMQDALRRRLQDTDEGDWLFGFGYDDSLLAERRHPTREDLDAVSAEHPIYIIHVSGHMGVANTLGLQRAGIEEGMPDPEGGAFGRDPETGRLNGLLLETPAIEMQLGLMKEIGLTKIYRMLVDAANIYAAQGVTTAQSGGVDTGFNQGLMWAKRLGLYPIRMVVFPFYDSLGQEILSGGFDPRSNGSDSYTIGAVKIVADGSIQGCTGYLSQAYHQPCHGDPAYRGSPNIAKEELEETVLKFHRAGLQLAIHANGDASIDDVITAFEAAQAAHPVADPRLILIHSQMAREDQLDAMKRLGITPSFFSAHTYYWGDRHRDVFIGPERAFRISPARSALDRDLRFSIHLDTPVVPMNPMLLVWSAVNRLSTSGEVIGAAQRISPMQALRAVTIDAAWQIFEEDNRGSLKPGKWADLIVLSGDPLVNLEKIRDIEVLETLVAGETIYTRH